MNTCVNSVQPSCITGHSTCACYLIRLTPFPDFTVHGPSASFWFSYEIVGLHLSLGPFPTPSRPTMLPRPVVRAETGSSKIHKPSHPLFLSPVRSRLKFGNNSFYLRPVVTDCDSPYLHSTPAFEPFMLGAVRVVSAYFCTTVSGYNSPDYVSSFSFLGETPTLPPPFTK